MHRFLVLLFVLAVSGCSTLKVNYDYDKEIDFNSFKTFSFLEWPQENWSLIGKFDKERLVNGVKAQMLDRGYSYREVEGDLMISLYVVVSQETATSSYSTYYGGGGYAYNPGWGWGGGYSATTYSTHDYINGTLVIDVFDHGSKKLAFQVVGSGTVDSDPEKRERNTGTVMNYLFKDFPKPKI